MTEMAKQKAMLANYQHANQTTMARGLSYKENGEERRKDELRGILPEQLPARVALRALELSLEVLLDESIVGLSS